MQYKLVPYGEKALLMQFKDEISLATHLKVKACYLQLKKSQIKEIESLIPAYNSLTIIINTNLITQKAFIKLIQQTNFITINKTTDTQQLITIPVCYDSSLGTDLKEVSKTLNLSFDEIIKLHTAKPYLVYMLGFAPGFMYLGGLNKQLHIARKKTPRLKIEAGSVGLADQQTGIYPLETPGGWQIIGQTPLNLFNKKKPALVKMGDLIQFKSISKQEFNDIRNL